jgi:hypothetical protein
MRRRRADDSRLIGAAGAQLESAMVKRITLCRRERRSLRRRDKQNGRTNLP